MKETKEIYLKDWIKNKSIPELIEALPFMVCKKFKNFRDEEDYNSYNVIGFNKDGIILGYTGSYLDEEADWGGWHSYDTYKVLPYKDIDNCYIVAHEATEKQKAFLEKWTKLDPDETCGYHAFKVISNIIEGWKSQRKQRTYSYTDDPYQGLDPDDWIDAADPWGN